jgi:endogenous inhibitor of DNA gyrase (YacG/DUF329 family)
MSNTRPLVVKCPKCGIEVIWSEQNSHRPFCSARCRDADLIDWAKEEHKIAGDNDDLLSGDSPED